MFRYIIARKVIRDDTFVNTPSYHTKCRCPRCHNRIMWQYQRHCSVCGQKLSWKERR